MVAIFALTHLKEAVSSLLIGSIIATMAVAALLVGTIAGIYVFFNRAPEAWGDQDASLGAEKRG